MTAEPFSLTALIDSVADTVGPDEHDIAAKVLPLIPESEQHAVALMTMARYIASRRVRLTQVLGSMPAPVATKASAPVTAGTTSRPVAQPSAKVARIRQYARSLDIRVKLGDGLTKYMRDCDFDDLMAAAAIRLDNAAANRRAAAQYTAAAELVQAHGVETYGDLPTDVVLAFEDDWQKSVAA